MNDDWIEKNQSDTEEFQKYPKVYQENKHYKSVKQKLMTASDNQEIIKFPLKSNCLQPAKIFQSFSSIITSKKVFKHQGKNVQIVPVRTISYSAPVNYKKESELTKFRKKQQKQTEQNIFNSKNLISNMKKLKDLRKTNYKNRIVSKQKKPSQKIQNLKDEEKLDMFRLTSTNFQYSNRMIQQSPQSNDFLRKLNQTQSTKRNIIKFTKKSPSKIHQNKMIELNNQSCKQNTQKQKNQLNFFNLLSVDIQNEQSLTKSKKALANYCSPIKQTNITRDVNESLKFQSDDESFNQEYLNTFVRYSQSQLDWDNQIIQKGLAKLRGLPRPKKQNHSETANPEHIPYSFKGSFRIKHLDDNKNILLNTIRKKAAKIDKYQLVQYLKKIVK